MVKPQENHRKMDVYPLVNIQKTMERSTMFNGKTPYKCTIIHCYVSLPECRVLRCFCPCGILGMNSDDFG